MSINLCFILLCSSYQRFCQTWYSAFALTECDRSLGTCCTSLLKLVCGFPQCDSSCMESTNKSLFCGYYTSCQSRDNKSHIYLGNNISQQFNTWHAKTLNIVRSCSNDNPILSIQNSIPPLWFYNYGNTAKKKSGVTELIYWCYISCECPNLCRGNLCLNMNNIAASLFAADITLHNWKRATSKYDQCFSSLTSFSWAIALSKAKQMSWDWTQSEQCPV